jgi:CPA1 family monovalent cation:H+ antiporter
MSIFAWLQESPEPEFIQFEIAFVLALLLTTLVAVSVKYLRFPYTVALVLVGLGLAVLAPQPLPREMITGEIILGLFVPPLVFEGALYINWRRFRENLVPILLMAVVGVLLSTLIVGGVILGIDATLEAAADALKIPNMDDLISIPLAAALAFGALISATDPVSVITFFRSLGVSRRLSVLVEGESLLNDGTSIVIFNLAVALGGITAVNHAGDNGQVTLPRLVWEFGYVAIGGIIIGLIVAALAHFVFIRFLNDRLVETTATMLIAFGSYATAESLHLSGILAVVAAGIFTGNQIPAHTTPDTKIVLYNFWEVVSFITTSLIFLIIGWEIDISMVLLPQNITLILSAVIAILVARALVVYGISLVSGWLGTYIPLSYRHVLFWGGLRGAISLALALSLGTGTFGRAVDNQLQLMTFSVVLFTLLVQGTTIDSLIRKLGLARRSNRQVEKERQLGRLYAARAAQKELARLHDAGVVSGSIYEAMLEAQQGEMEQRDLEVRELLRSYPDMGIELALQVRRAMLQAERAALGEALRQEIVSEQVQEQILEEISARIEVLDAVGAHGTSTSITLLPDEMGEEVDD